MGIQEDQKKSNWLVVYIIIGFSILCFIGILLSFSFNEESIRLNIRWSARFSIICFCLAFSASAFNLLFKNNLSRWLLKNRRYLGVSFAIIHLIHLIFLVILHQNFYQVFLHRSLFTISLGGIAYVFIILMLFTSFEVFSKLIDQTTWNRLHKIGGYWILIVFSNGMIGRVVEGKIAYLPFGILVVTVWITRLIAWRKKKYDDLISRF